MFGVPLLGTTRRRTTALASASILAAATALTACAGEKEILQAADAPIQIQTSQLSVVVENRAGGPLLDVNVSIVAPGAPTYTRVISRIEAGDKRDISLSEFSSRDGTTFNLRLVKPRTVKVTATDLTAKKYDAETSWR